VGTGGPQISQGRGLLAILYWTFRTASGMERIEIADMKNLGALGTPLQAVASRGGFDP